MNPRNSLSSFALIAALGLSLAGCGGSSPATTAPTSPSVESIGATPAAPATEGPKKSPRGNIVKQLGEAGSVTTPDGKPMVNFVINSITPDAPCSGPYPSALENGHTVILDVTIETTEELGNTANGGIATFDMNASMFKFVGANGTTFNGNLGTVGAYSCLPDEQTIGANGAGIGPAEKVTGKIALDVPETTGTLVFKSYMLSNAGGWEWAF